MYKKFSVQEEGILIIWFSCITSMEKANPTIKFNSDSVTHVTGKV